MDEFINLYLDYWRDFSKFEGRTSRKRFWILVLIIFIISVSVGIVCRFLWIFGDIIQGLYGLANLIPALALGWRRMHDTGREGWWCLIPVINIIFAVNDSDGPNQYGNPVG